MRGASPASLDYRPDIDGLRSIAVLLVLAFHFRLMPAMASGFLGVDVFFVISGFLITSIITRQLAAGTFRFSTFYLHRIRRLAPALFCVLALVLLAGWLLLFPAEFEDLARQVAASQFYVANIYYWKSINYFGLRSENVFLLHTWSLAVEEQFYLLFPLAVYLLYRYLRRGLWIALALGLALSLGLNIAFVGSRPEAVFYLLPTRAWELLLGSLLCHAGIARAGVGERSRELLGLAGAALLLAGVLGFREGIAFPGAFALLPTLGAACLIAAGSGMGSTASRLLGLAPLVYLGRISYPLYLVHWPLNVFARQAFGAQYTTPWRILMFALSILLAMMIYHGIEQPVRRGRRFAGRGAIAGIYLAGLAVSALAVLAVQLTAGFPQRFTPEVARLASFERDTSDDALGCEFQGSVPLRPEAMCRIGVPGIEPQWLVYGDSHALAGHGAFDRWLAGRGQAGIFVFRNSCPPVAGLHVVGDRGLCFAFNQAVADLLVANPSLHNVLLVSTWRQAIEGRLSSAPDAHLPAAEALRLFADRFDQTLARLDAEGRRVYLWEPVPGARQNVPLALARRAQGRSVDAIEYTRDEYLAQFDFFFQAQRRNARFIARSFSPSAVLCASGKCAVERNGDPLYSDDAHVARSSADFWAGLLRAQDGLDSGL